MIISFRNYLDLTIISKLKIWFLAFIALYSMQPYFLWDKSIFLYGSSACVLLFVIIQLGFKDKKEIPLKTVCSACIFLVFFLWWHLYFKGIIEKHTSLFGLLGPFVFTFFPVVVFSLCSEKEKQYFLFFFTNLISIICFFSLVFFIMYLIGIPLPSYKIYHPTNIFYHHFDCYRMFIIVRNGYSIPIFTRFQSIFTEPGHLGMMCALLLYANNYDFKKIKNIILGLSIVFSLSLAAYILLVAGIFFYKFFKSNKKIIILIVFILIGLLGLVIGSSYYKKHTDTVISQRILSRLVFDEEKGIAGNNRNTVSFENEYNKFKESFILVMFGSGTSVGEKFPKGGNSSYKNFIFEHGLLGLLLLISFYLSFANKKNMKFVLGMFFLWSLSFIQRPYATWECQIFIFLAAASNNLYYKKY